MISCLIFSCRLFLPEPQFVTIVFPAFPLSGVFLLSASTEVEFDIAWTDSSHSVSRAVVSFSAPEAAEEQVSKGCVFTLQTLPGMLVVCVVPKVVIGGIGYGLSPAGAAISDSMRLRERLVLSWFRGPPSAILMSAAERGFPLSLFAVESFTDAALDVCGGDTGRLDKESILKRILDGSFTKNALVRLPEFKFSLRLDEGLWVMDRLDLSPVLAESGGAYVTETAVAGVHRFFRVSGEPLCRSFSISDDGKVTAAE